MGSRAWKKRKYGYFLLDRQSTQLPFISKWCIFNIFFCCWCWLNDILLQRGELIVRFATFPLLHCNHFVVRCYQFSWRSEMAITNMDFFSNTLHTGHEWVLNEIFRKNLNGKCTTNFCHSCDTRCCCDFHLFGCELCNRVAKKCGWIIIVWCLFFLNTNCATLRIN